MKSGDKVCGFYATGEDVVFILETLGGSAGAQFGVEAVAGLRAVDGLDGWGAEEGHLSTCAWADVEDGARGAGEEGWD